MLFYCMKDAPDPSGFMGESPSLCTGGHEKELYTILIGLLFLPHCVSGACDPRGAEPQRRCLLQEKLISEREDTDRFQLSPPIFLLI